MCTGSPAAMASSWAWQVRSMVMNHHAASSTEWPTVSRPWLRRMAALLSPRAWAMRLPSMRVEHDAGEVVEQDVVVVEGAGVLGDRVEQLPERRERLAVHRVGVGGGDDVGPGGVDLGVDGEGRLVDGVVALDDGALVVDAHEVGHPDQAEVDTEGVQPEAVGELGVANGDVPGDALPEPEPPEQAERGGQSLLAVHALVGHVVEHREVVRDRLRRRRGRSGWPRSRAGRSWWTRRTSGSSVGSGRSPCVSVRV